MILTVLFLTLVSSCMAQSADKNVQQRSPRIPHGIQYSDPDGSKVDWKLYTPENRRQTQAVIGGRSHRAEMGTGQTSLRPKQQIVQAPIEQQPHYQPYSAVPSHIKQLIVQAYTPQGPYVDPGAFFYQAPASSVISSVAPQSKKDQSASSQTPVEKSYFNSAVNYRAEGYEQAAQASTRQVSAVPSKLGGNKYKNEDRIYQRSTQVPYGSVIPVQSQIKPQYQPYKQIQESQSQYQQYSKEASQPQPNYQQYNKQVNQPQFHYEQYNKQASQPQLNYQQYNGQVTQPQFQYEQYNKQASVSQHQHQYQQFDKQAVQSQLQYQRHNKQPSPPQQYRQDSQPQEYKQPSQYQLIKPVSQLNYEKNTPMAIQTLLDYQAQLPYNVIANHILYRPKQLFIPKPLPESAKLARQYPSKIYFIKTDGEVYAGPETIQDVKSEKRY